MYTSCRIPIAKLGNTMIRSVKGILKLSKCVEDFYIAAIYLNGYIVIVI